MTYIIWIISVYGLSYILSQSTLGEVYRKMFIFERPNTFQSKLAYLVNCIICTSAWVSLLLTAAFSPAAIFGIPFICQLIVNMIFGLGCTKLIYSLIEKIPNQFE
jgi:uncharacterized membrane protein